MVVKLCRAASDGGLAREEVRPHAQGHGQHERSLPSCRC
jgi:hypothetical protein